MHHSTSNSHPNGHPAFSLEWDGNEIIKPCLDLLVQWLETEIASGRRFQPGETVQFGWSILEIQRRHDGTLALFEPDFASMPIAFVDSVSATLYHTTLQKFAADSVGLTGEMQIPSLLQSGLVCSRFGNKGPILLDRATSSQPHASGWFCGCRKKDHDHNDISQLQRKSLYEIAALLDSRIIPFLSLPTGTMVSLDGSRLDLWLNGKPLLPASGSYLAEKYPK